MVSSQRFRNPNSEMTPTITVACSAENCWLRSVTCSLLARQAPDSYRLAFTAGELCMDQMGMEPHADRVTTSARGLRSV